MRDCYFCDGKTKKQFVIYSKWHKGKLIAIGNVPAEVCEQCGEQYFSPETAKDLQKIVLSKKKPDKTIKVPLFDLASYK